MNTIYWQWLKRDDGVWEFNARDVHSDWWKVEVYGDSLSGFQAEISNAGEVIDIGEFESLDLAKDASQDQLIEHLDI